MRYFTLVFTACLLLLLACKKGQKNAPGTSTGVKKYPVEFNVGGFSQTYGGIGTQKTNSLKTNSVDSIPVGKIFFRLAASDGTLYDTRIVSKTASGFGTFRDSVPPGTYNVIFFGGDGLVTTGGNLIYNRKDTLQWWNDTFYKSFNFTVNGAQLSQNVQLDRISAQLVLNIEDAIPAGVTKIAIAYDDFGYLNYQTLMGQGYSGVNAQANIISSDVGKTNYQIVSNSMTFGSNITVRIGYSINNSNLSTKVIAVGNVTLTPNKRTILSGKLFSDQYPTFTVIQADTTWNAPSNQHF